MEIIKKVQPKWEKVELEDNEDYDYYLIPSDIPETAEMVTVIFYKDDVEVARGIQKV